MASIKKQKEHSLLNNLIDRKALRSLPSDRFSSIPVCLRLLGKHPKGQLLRVITYSTAVSDVFPNHRAYGGSYLLWPIIDSQEWKRNCRSVFKSVPTVEKKLKTSNVSLVLLLITQNIIVTTGVTIIHPQSCSQRWVGALPVIHIRGRLEQCRTEYRID